MKKLTTEEFIQKAKKIHGDKYDYSLVKYIGALINVKIICFKHGEFNLTPNRHLLGKGCPKCGNKIKTTTQLIEDFNYIHNNKYDYNLVVYKNQRTKIKIICPIHGVFEQHIGQHLRGHGCDKCRKKSSEQVLIDFKKTHGDKYNYSLVDYNAWNIPVKIICPIHGVFEQSPNNHIRQGCPVCKESKGERIIRNWLIDSDINFIRQKKFKECKNIQSLLFDFYLPDFNLCIEFDGEQHFRINNTWGEQKFLQTQKNDIIKTVFCLKNNIELIRIKYNELKNIDCVLSKLKIPE